MLTLESRSTLLKKRRILSTSSESNKVLINSEFVNGKWLIGGRVKETLDCYYFGS